LPPPHFNLDSPIEPPWNFEGFSPDVLEGLRGGISRPLSRLARSPDPVDHQSVPNVSSDSPLPEDPPWLNFAGFNSPLPPMPLLSVILSGVTLVEDPTHLALLPQTAASY